MTTKTNETGFLACPLCSLYDFVETECGGIIENMSIMSSIWCGECHLQVSGNTLEEAIEKWNKLNMKE